MAWNEGVVTNEGIALLKRVTVSDEVFLFTRCMADSEYINPMQLLSLKNISKGLELKLVQVIQENNAITVNIRGQNSELNEAYTIKKIGIYAKSERADEILFAVIEDQIGEIIPSHIDNPDYLLDFDFYFPITNLNSPKVEITSGTFATFEDLKQHVENEDNPHKVTKEQVELGNVPNVSTNNQTPTYTTAESLTELSSGEKLSSALGKIAKAIKSLIEHIEDKVKHITAAERTDWNSKAAGDHTHTAADVGALTNIKIGTVTTGAAGSNASASASTSGTVTTLNLTIPKGETGAAAGFGTPTATVDANVGTPTVTVTATGSNTAKVFNFVFKNLKGATGATGAKGDTGATGAAGAKGETGTRGSRWSAGTAITGTSTAATIFSGSGITDALVNDMYLNTSTGNTYRCTVAGAAAAAKWVYAGCIKGAVGATGAKGDKGDTGTAGAKGDKGDTGASGAKGDKGDTGLVYGTCSTAAATAAKTVALTGFALATGAAVIVKFTVTNTASNPTLNVNSTGAKTIKYRNANIAADVLTANRVYVFVYDGTYWQLIGDLDTVYTHPTTAGNKHIPTGGSANQILAYSASGTAKWSSICNAAAINVVTGTVSTSIKTVAYQAGRSKALIIGYPASCVEGKAAFGSVLLTGLSSSMTAIPSTLVLAFSGSMGLSYAVSESGVISIAGYIGSYCVIWFN